jgi:serine/threonine protein kinase
MVNSNQSDPNNASSLNNPATPQSSADGLPVQPSLQMAGDQAVHSKRLAPGTILSSGRYNIERAVAAGGMGAVYRAVDTRFNRPCAVKEMLDEYHSDSERNQAVEWFEREATLLLDLNHPCIPRVRDFFVEGSKHYLVMDYIEGMTLGEVLEKEGNIVGVNDAHGVTEARARSWGQQICSVLGYLHSQTPPIIFRDLKPSNIMVTAREEIKLIDFGIARNFQPQSQSTIIMTVGYAPLEQVAGNAEPRSDLYALGATLHRILTHHDAANNRPDIFTFPPVRSLRPDVSVAFEQVIMRALAPLPQRWPNAIEMERAIINLPRITITPPVAPGGNIPGQSRLANPLTPASSMAPSAPNTPPRSLSNSTTGPAGATIISALEFISANRIEEAYAAVQQAYVLEPKNALVHRIFGQVFARRRPPQIDHAVQAYNFSLQLNPNDSETHKLLGDVSLFLRKQPLPAIPAYIQSLRLNPNDVEAHQRLAQSYEETNQPEPALREYQEAARLAPSQAGLHLKVGQLALRLNQLPVAERAFITVLRLHPEDYQTRFLLSQVYENEGKLIDAERECSYVIRVIPAAQPMLARLRSRLGR